MMGRMYSLVITQETQTESTFAVSQIGLILGPLVGGALTTYTTWRWCKMTGSLLDTTGSNASYQQASTSIYPLEL
jgi:MFS family permease